MRFFMIDRIVSWKVGRSAEALKNISLSEDFFDDHFPRRPVMPGVLILEAMAQACGVLANLTLDELDEGAMNYLVKIDKAKFKRKVIPGDQILMEVKQKRLMRGMGVYECKSSVEGKPTASCEILSAGG